MKGGADKLDLKTQSLELKKELKKDKSFSQRKLAEYCSVSASIVSQWVNGKQKISDAKLPLVESYFNVNFSNDKKPKKVNKKAKVNQVEKITDNLISSSSHLKPPDSCNEKYDLIRNDLSDQLEAQGKFGKHYESILDHLVYFFKLKDELQYDIETNGIRIEISTGNGHPKIVDNPSIKNLNSVSSRIMTIIKDLNLEDEEPADGFTFDEFT